jgi:hypothetical protein
MPSICGGFGCVSTPVATTIDRARRLVPSERPSRPAVRRVVEGPGRDPGVEPDPLAQVVLVDAVLGIGLQLAARRVDARPVGALLEGELVAERGDVDTDARVGVPVPGAADAVALLDQQESEKPARSSSIAAPIPEKPAPMIDDLVVQPIRPECPGLDVRLIDLCHRLLPLTKMLHSRRFIVTEA